MKIFCPNCEAITECDFEIEIYYCKTCQEDFAAYEKPATTNLKEELETATRRIENLKMSPDHSVRAENERLRGLFKQIAELIKGE